MKRSYVVMAALLLLAIAALALLSSRLSARAQDQTKPTVVPADFLTPVPTPPDAREVAILTLFITSSPDGKVEKVELQRGSIVQGYAPNVSERPGEWTVEVLGDEKFSFGVGDPRRLDVSAEPNQPMEAPHTTEFQTEVTWELVVPLYLFDQDLHATTINIYDQSGNLIFTTPVDRENWKRQ